MLMLETVWMFLVHAIARNHVEVRILALLTIKVKEATFAVVLMTADAQLGKRDSIFGDNPYSLLVSPPPK